MIDRIKHDLRPDELVWKYERENITLGAQLIVNESQEALFFKGGQALDLFGPGTHTLSTKNLPFLQRLINLPFGGETPFAAEIYFVNRAAKLDYKWGTRTPFPIEDPKYHAMVSVSCHGQLGLRVEDSRAFITQIVGTLPHAESELIVDYFRGAILNRVKEATAKLLVDKKISIVEVTAQLGDLSQTAEDNLRGEFAKYGLALLRLFVETIAIPDEEKKAIQKAQFDRLQIDMLGDSRYQMKRTYDTLEAAANNTGGTGTLMAAGVGLGIGAQLAGSVGNMTTRAMGPQPAQAPEQGTPCPKCGATIQAGGRFCPQCGTPSPSASVCSGCNAPIPPGAKFCSGCGARVSSPSACAACGAPLTPGARFCNQCGKASA